MAVDLYTYVATARRVIDGDTLELMFDLGFYLVTTQRVRLLGIDCPEKDTEAGLQALAYTTQWVDGRVLFVETTKTDSFGRWLAEVLDSKTGESLAESLLRAGLAKPWTGKGAAHG